MKRLCPNCGYELGTIETSNESPRLIIEEVGRLTGVDPCEIIGRDRSRRETRARQIAAAAVRRMTKMSYPDLGELFDGRDHTTMMYAVNKAEEEYSHWIDEVIASV